MPNMNTSNFGMSPHIDDNTAPLQDAIDTVHRLGGGIVSMPAGRFYVHSPVYLKSGVIVLGTGTSSIIEAASDFNGDAIIAADNVLRSQVAFLFFNAETCAAPFVKAIHVAQSDRVWVRDCEFSSIPCGVKVSGGTEITIRDNIITDTSQVGILITSEQEQVICDVSIDNNRINNSEVNGIKIQGDVNAKKLTTAAINVCNNTVRNCTKEGILGLWADKLKITGNDCVQNERGVLLSAGCESSIVSDNRCDNNTLEGINLDTISADDQGNHVMHNHFVVHSNKCQDNAGAGIRSSNPANVLIADNHTRRNRYGIMVSGDGSYPYDPEQGLYPKGHSCIVNGNHVELNTDIGITIAGDPDGYIESPLVSNNLVRANGTAQSQSASGGIKLNATSNALVTDNHCVGNWVHNGTNRIQRADLNVHSENEGLVLRGNTGKIWFTTRSGYPMSDLGSNGLQIREHTPHISEEPTIKTVLYKLGDEFQIHHMGMDAVFVESEDGTDKVSDALPIDAGFKGQRLVIHNEGSAGILTVLLADAVAIDPGQSVSLFFDGAAWLVI